MGTIAELAAGEPELGAADVISALRLRERGSVDGRPRVVVAMIASADGRATVAGRSAGLGHPMDRAIFRGLRGSADAVLVGAATVRAERYANLFDEEHIQARAAAGLAARPTIAVVTRSGAVPWDVGLFAEPESTILVATGTPVDVPPTTRARVEVLLEADGAAVLARLAARDEAQLVLCEGGPRLLGALAQARLVDDLVLTIAPMLVGGIGPSTLTAPELDPPLGLSLAGAWRADEHLFLHYAA